MSIINYAQKIVLGDKILGIELLPSGNIDANSISKSCAYQISSTDLSRVSNLPVQSVGVLWVPIYQAGFWRVQFYLEQASSNIWFRTGASSSWGTWKKFTITTA